MVNDLLVNVSDEMIEMKKKIKKKIHYNTGSIKYDCKCSTLCFRVRISLHKHLFCITIDYERKNERKMMKIMLGPIYTFLLIRVTLQES